jgi:uncharacterized membrane protein YedE/YeeE
MRNLAVALGLGLLFGLGIAISGMIDPAKVINFFDIAGTWDPSLAFVMGGGLAASIPGYQYLFRRGKPLFAGWFSLPNARDIDAPLIWGSGVFGIGWGLAGFCPGGAIPALGLGRIEPILFVGGMIVGMLIARTLRTRSLTTAPA